VTVRVRNENINTQKFWDETWQSEPLWHRSFGIDPARYEALALPVLAGMRVLDVGGGRGEFLNWLGREVHRTLFDHSQVAVNYATENGWAEEGVVGDCTHHLPFKDRAFDAVYCNEVLEHVEDPAALVSELRRVAAVYVSVSTPLRNTPDDRQHVWSFDVGDIADLLSWGKPDVKVVGTSIVAVVAP
jgi:2-polyprenyl-3-methyl-5-hydroxy-6-metoxy-1,4-benzoquinol methylase